MFQVVIFWKVGANAVLSIRGTLSLEDCMTDFLCEPASLNEWIAGIDGNKDTPKSFNEEAPAVQLASRGDITAHAGILEAAKAVVKDLQVSYSSLYCFYITSLQLWTELNRTSM